MNAKVEGEMDNEISSRGTCERTVRGFIGIIR